MKALAKKEVEGQGGQIDFSSPQMVQTLKRTVAQGLDDHEFFMFLEMCKSTGLNPFKKEVWAIKAGGRVQIMCGLNGYLAIANSHPEFDGLETEVHEKDGKIIAASCTVHRKDRAHPTTSKVYFDEYKLGTPIWNTKPRTMIEKVAISHAIRRSFPTECSGTYTEDEMPANGNGKTIEVQPQTKQIEKPEEETIDWDKYAYRYELPKTKKGVDMVQVHQWLDANGFKYRKEDNSWYGDLYIEKLKAYAKETAKGVESDDISFEDDEMPLWGRPEKEEKPKKKGRYLKDNPDWVDDVKQTNGGTNGD